jgi:hypothetical protein
VLLVLLAAFGLLARALAMKGTDPMPLDHLTPYEAMQFLAAYVQ